MSDSVTFVIKALDFLSENWTFDKKYTQQKVAGKLNISDSTISKARNGSVTIAKKLKPKLLSLIEELDGSYSETEQVFINKSGKVYDATIGNDNYKIEKVDGVKLIRLLRGTERSDLDILTTWLDEVGDITDYLRKNKEILKGKTIRLLLLHPDSYGTLLRSKLLSADIETGFNRIKEDLYNLHSIFDDYEEKPDIVIRLYHELPSINLIVTKEVLIVGFYINQEYSKNTEQIILKKDNNLEFVKKLEENFETIWGKSKKNELTLADIPSKLERFTTPAYKRFNIYRYSQFTGTFYLFYTEKYSPNDYRIHKTAASIGVNILKIKYKGEGVFKVTMKAAGVDESKQEYYGELVNQKFNSPDYILMNLTNKTKTRHLSLYFHIKDTDKLKKESIIFGLFTVIYRTSGKIGSGLSVLSRIGGEEQYKEKDPDSLDPAKIRKKHNNRADIKKYKAFQPILTDEIISYLVNKQKSLILSASSLSQITNETDIDEVKGTYYVYAYSGDHENPKITKGIISISSSGILYRNRINGYEGVGWFRVDTDKKNIYIDVRNSNPNYKRSALFIINYQNRIQKKYLEGVCASTTWHDGVPVAAKVIFEEVKFDFEKEEPQKIKANSEDFAILPLIVKQKLTGIESSMVGFLEDEGKIDLAEVFYKAACYDAIQKNVTSFLSNLKHAVTHGFGDIKKIEVFKKQMSDHIKEVSQIIKLMNKIQK